VHKRAKKPLVVLSTSKAGDVSSVEAELTKPTTTQWRRKMATPKVQ
jgi:hypothetical protein